MLSPIVLQWPQSRSPERPRVQWPALSGWSLGLGLRPYNAAPSSGSLLFPQNRRKWGTSEHLRPTLLTFRPLPSALGSGSGCQIVHSGPVSTGTPRCQLWHKSFGKSSSARPEGKRGGFREENGAAEVQDLFSLLVSLLPAGGLVPQDSFCPTDLIFL